MRRDDPHSLTPREREVLDLLRRGLTNEEIAQRLGITLDGAKYHVSQILSKLGVSTREEAAALGGQALSLAERPWWLRAALWAKIAGAATVAAALVGLAVLAWGVLRTEEEEEDVPILTPEQLYERVSEAISRPGFVLYSTESDESVPPVNYYSWIDGTNGVYRFELHFPTFETATIVDGEYWYASTFDGFRRWAMDPESDFCPGSRDAALAFLLCGWTTAPLRDSTARVESEHYEGRDSVVLVLEARGSDVWIGRTYVAADTFLPIVRMSELRSGRHTVFSDTEPIDHEFIPRSDLPADFFDPASIGYTVEPSPTP